ncbi:hypothetical protein DD238_008190 [Peronospora effusa]|uniref:Uncharacterized protein n=1 Tax=Peronospora effusa TaxID=542832 RepID=A0A3M6VPP4_9STRA|nr:hypothetical protein DD238_008190 [Peronospora effusa]RQM12031.1 hypothetical protein DD237_008245 [Peronospora effusa]
MERITFALENIKGGHSGEQLKDICFQIVERLGFLQVCNFYIKNQEEGPASGKQSTGDQVSPLKEEIFGWGSQMEDESSS